MTTGGADGVAVAGLDREFVQVGVVVEEDVGDGLGLALAIT